MDKGCTRTSLIESNVIRRRVLILSNDLNLIRSVQLFTRIASLFISPSRYVCLGGSPTPRPVDGVHGYPCPAGHSCPVGTATETPCEPGTYSPSPGSAHCLTCPNGTMCPSLATQNPSLCPSGEAHVVMETLMYSVIENSVSTFLSVV